LNIERAGARSRPSVIPRLRCLRSMEKDYNMSCHPERSKGPWFLHAAATRMVQARTMIPRFARDDKCYREMTRVFLG